MATYTKPIASELPIWNDGLANASRPLTAVLDAGHAVSSIPSSTTENWRAHAVGSWFKWLDERIDDADSGDSIVIYDPGAAANHTTFVTGGNIDFSGRFDQDQLLVNGTTSADPQGIVGLTGAFPFMSLYMDVDNYFALTKVIGVVTHSWVLDTVTEMALVEGVGLSIEEGLHVGGASVAPAADSISIGPDTDFKLQYAANPYLQFDSTDNLTFDSTANSFQFQTASTTQLEVDATGLTTIGGDSSHQLLSSGDDMEWVVDGSSNKVLFDRSAETFQFFVNSTSRVSIDTSGLTAAADLVALLGDVYAGNGLVVGSTGTAPTSSNMLRIDPRSSEPGGSVKGDILCFTDTGKLRVHNGNEYDRVLSQSYASTTVVTKISTEAPVAFDTYTIPADSLTDGGTLRLRMAVAEIGGSGTGTIGIELRIGGVVVGSLSIPTGSPIEGYLEATVTILSAAVNTAVTWSSVRMAATTTAAFTLNTGGSTIDNSSATAIEAYLSLGGTTNTLELHQFIVDWV